MKFDLEKYILDKINSGEWQENSLIPTESKLIELSGFSKMTVRKTIEKLKSHEVLYSVQGKGVFISPFHDEYNIDRLQNILGADKISYIPSSAEIPAVLLKKYDKNIDLSNKKILTYVKTYTVKDKIAAYTINWVINDNDKYTLRDVISQKKSVYKNKDFNKIINIERMRNTTKSDKEILNTNDEYLPTIYSYYIKNDRSLVMLRVSKIIPRFYKAFEIKGEI